MIKNIKNLLNLLRILSLCAPLTGCFSPFHFINYSSLNTPRYSYNAHEPEENLNKKTIKVVSYNIKHSIRLGQAIKILKTSEDLKDLDILLLQEMVPSAVEKIAQALDANYVFYPAVKHPILEDNFGNAVISKWPITYDQNIIFPSIKEKSRHRIAVAARIIIKDKPVLIYSLHMGIFMKPQQRSEQIQGILKAIPEETSFCIIGGDFNTLTKKNEEEVIRTFSRSGFDHATGNVDWTYNQWYLLNKKSVLDHIFSRGMIRLRSGKVNDRSASDHIPIWAEFSL